MSVAPTSALGASWLGMQRSLQQTTAAAATIAQVSESLSAAAPGSDATAPAPAAGVTDLAGAMITIRTAQRMFAASAAEMRTADETSRLAIGLGAGSKR